MNNLQRDNTKRKFNLNSTTLRPAEISIKSQSENTYKVQVTWLLRELPIFTQLEKSLDWIRPGFKNMWNLKFLTRLNIWAEQTLRTFLKLYNNRIQTCQCLKSIYLKNKQLSLIMWQELGMKQINLSTVRKEKAITGWLMLWNLEDLFQCILWVNGHVLFGAEY